MNEERGTVRGRGVGKNPRNRFETLEYTPDPADASDDHAAPQTRLLRDSARSIIAYNQSPDVGFDASVNPYRGCEHGCVYCLSGDTPILMADGMTRRLGDIRVGDEIYGTVRSGWYRRYVRTHVLAHWEVVKPALRVSLEDGTELIAGGDHRFLTDRGWKFVTDAEEGGGQRPHLTSNNKLMGTGAFVETPEETLDYRRGYLSGVIRGDGLLASYAYKREGRSHGNQFQFRLALADIEALERARRYLLDVDVATNEFVFSKAVGSRKTLTAIRTHARARVQRIEEVVAWPISPPADWCRGFLAGIFDAEGSYSGGCLRIANTDTAIIHQILRCLEQFGFTHAIDTAKSRDALVYVRLRGGLREHLRFFHTVKPAITRKRDIEGQAVRNGANLRVHSVERLGIELPLFDITTGTGDFVANGVVSHNCYARPTHEYLGFSGGLDFETKIMVKEDAPELLRRELASPRWTPQPVAISGVTDAYQPIERRLGLTRRCLEVLVEFRNPAVIVTKSALVVRDLDLLGELAGYGAAAVFLSVTSLDPDVSRALEPRAAQPERRLEAIERLAAAGVPVGVLVAPVIPGLTDHEIPAILAACGRAGAGFAGYTPVRLPLGVADLFERWLEQRFPDRKEKVLNRIRSLRDGKLNDSSFEFRMKGRGPFAEQIDALFRIGCKKAGITGQCPELSTDAFRRPAGAQLSLF